MNAANGIKIWNNTIGTWGNGGSAPVVVDGIVYTRSETGILGLNPNNGAVIWNNSNMGLVFASNPVIVKGVLYVGSGDGQVYAIRAPSAPPEPFPTVTAAGFLRAVIVVVVVAGLLVYHKKHKRSPVAV